jgi:hypothetical protein
MTTAKRSMALIFLEDPVCGMTVDPEEARGQATILPMKATLGRGPTDPPSRHPVEGGRTGSSSGSRGGALPNANPKGLHATFTWIRVLVPAR